MELSDPVDKSEIGVTGIEIHHIGQSGGDATAIVIKYKDEDGAEKRKHILIDAGGESAGSGVRPVLAYLTSQLGNPTFDYIIATHYHADHITGFQSCNVKFNAVVDNGGYNLRGTQSKPVNPIGALTQASGTFNTYALYITDEIDKSNGTKKRITLPFINPNSYQADGKLKDASLGGPFSLDLGFGFQSDVSLTCYCANGILANGTNVLLQNIHARVMRAAGFNWPEATILAKDTDKQNYFNYKGKSFDEEVKKALDNISPNDLSLAFILEWPKHNFRYFIAGDLSGDLTLSCYCNIEQPLIAYLSTMGKPKQLISVMKATHHGSNHNNYPSTITEIVNYQIEAAVDEENDGKNIGESKQVTIETGDNGLLGELSPETIIVPCNQMKGVPGKKYLQRLLEYCREDESINVWFVNTCRYPQDSYAQKAELTDLEAFIHNGVKTNLDSVSIGAGKEIIVSGSHPRAVIVHIPAFLEDETQYVYADKKGAYSIMLDHTPIDVMDVDLSDGNKLKKLPDLSLVQVEELKSSRIKRAEEIIKISEQYGVEYIKYNLPALLDNSTNDLISKEPEQLSFELHSLLILNYEETMTFTYAPKKSIKIEIHITLESYIRNTPNGLGPIDNEIAQLRRENNYVTQPRSKRRKL